MLVLLLNIIIFHDQECGCMMQYMIVVHKTNLEQDIGTISIEN